jgi:hypothetical protein
MQLDLHWQGPAASEVGPVGKVDIGRIGIAEAGRRASLQGGSVHSSANLSEAPTNFNIREV